MDMDVRPSQPECLHEFVPEIIAPTQVRLENLELRMSQLDRAWTSYLPICKKMLQRYLDEVDEGAIVQVEKSCPEIGQETELNKGKGIDHQAASGHSLQSVSRRLEEVEANFSASMQKSSSGHSLRSVSQRLETLEAKFAASMQISSVCTASSLQDPKLDTHTFRNSVWDALFIQIFCNGLLDRGLMVFIYLTNLVLQLAMCYLVYVNLSLDDWVDADDLEEFLRWRITISQSMDLYNIQSNTSLATRVCSGDRARNVANEQAVAYEQLTKYIVDNSPFNGPLLCLIAVFLWILVIQGDMRCIAEFTVAVFSLPRGARSRGKIETDGEQFSFSIDCISTAACAFAVVAISIPRFVVGAFIGYAGMLFVVHSESLEDLILNCIAIGFVLDMDELLFIFVPKMTAWHLSSTKAIILQASHVHTGWRRLSRSLDVGQLCSILSMLLLAPGMYLVYENYVKPLQDTLRAASAILCGGQKEIVFQIDLSNSVITYARTSAYERGETPPISSFYDHAVLQALGLHDEPVLAEVLEQYPRAGMAMAREASLQKLNTLRLQTAEEAKGVQLCLDLDYDEPARAALKELVGIVSCNMTDGNDLWGRCNEVAMQRYCPQTCYCNRVSWWHDRSGCPPKCIHEYEAHVTAYLHDLEHGTGCRETVVAWDSAPPYGRDRGGNFTFFSGLIRQELIAGGQLDMDGRPAPSVLTRAQRLSLNRIQMTNASLDFDRIVYDMKCDGMLLFDRLFDLKLCDAGERFRRGFGSMAPFCVETCRSCDSSQLQPETTFEELVSAYWGGPSIKEVLEPHFKAGFEWIFCGETRPGTTVGAPNFIHRSSGEKVFEFWAEPGISYSFEAQSQSFGMSLQVHAELEQSALHNATPRFAWSRSTLLKNITFPKEQQYYLVVEAMLAHITDDFQVRMTSNGSSCGLSIPQLIQCDDVVNASTENLVNIWQGSGHDKIFKFWADKGVEYAFDSCGSSIKTELHLYDEWFRTPAVLTPGYDSQPSSPNCAEEKRGHLTWRCEESGYYHIIIEGISGWTQRNGNVTLAIQCM